MVIGHESPLLNFDKYTNIIISVFMKIKNQDLENSINTCTGQHALI